MYESVAGSKTSRFSSGKMFLVLADPDAQHYVPVSSYLLFFIHIPVLSVGMPYKMLKNECLITLPCWYFAIFMANCQTGMPGGKRAYNAKCEPITILLHPILSSHWLYSV
jgi:hypothetical protein